MACEYDRTVYFKQLWGALSVTLSIVYQISFYTTIRNGFRILTTSKMKLFVASVHSWNGCYWAIHQSSFDGKIPVLHTFYYF